MGRTETLQHPLVIAGVLLTTISGIAFLALVAAELAGLYVHPYAGLVVFVIVPALFVIGLLLIPLGRWRWGRTHGPSSAGADDWPIIDFGDPTVRRRAIVVAALTVVNVAIVLTSVTGTIRWMESPGFCGQLCHRAMEPQFTAWQGAQHAEVTCTDCHVGEGARALVRAKLAGVRQLYHVATNQVPTPIPGVADMRPAGEICGRCHWSGRNSGEVVRIKRAYADDEGNSETLTILRMMVGGPGSPTAATGRAIHWHAGSDAHIAFIASDAERQTIPYVRSMDKDGKLREYRAKGSTDAEVAQGSLRVMDCIDCHNTPAHRIAPTVEQAVDEAIEAGQVSRTLPFIRREAVRLANVEYGTQEQGVQRIAEGLRAFYRASSDTAKQDGQGSRIDDRELTRTIASLQTVYRRNVFPAMKVTFGVYPTNLGHTSSAGCFRCHDGEHVAADGATISADCEYCHTQVDATGAR